MLRGRMTAQTPHSVNRPFRPRRQLAFACLGLSTLLLTTSASAQIPRRGIPRPATSQPTTTPTDTTPAVSRPIEPPSEPALAPPRRTSGYTGASPLPRGTPTADFLPISDRWRIGVPPERRFYTEPGAFGGTTTGPLEPYKQNVLKGDYPILGQDIFLALSATSDTLLEARRLPVPSGTSTRDADALAFFGAGRQYLVNQNFILSMELFQGDTAYRPRDWEFRFTPVINYNYVSTQELGLVDPDVHNGRDRHDEWIGLQELFFEKHLGDLSVNYDFWSSRFGIQGFTSDFRGFLFSDNEPGVRIFGTADNFKTQWNLAWFAMLEKDTNSGLNAYSLRDQQVVIANIYRQDFLGILGYTAQASFHANLDDSGDLEIDQNGVIVRPAPVGIIKEKQVNAYYLGWAGDGHIGRLNLTHQFYWALGYESFNPIAQREVDINAQFFALELSYDQDWIRYRASFLWASGDDDPFDGKARGFDSIFDNPNFAGGGTSLFVRQAIRLTGSGVSLVNRNSLLPDLRTTKEQGQSNFVNPGLFIYNVGMDFDITPKLKAIANVSWLMFDDTSVIQEVLHDNKIGRDIGLDYSVGLQWRPFLNNNAIINVGAAALTPGNGFRDIYSNQTLYSVFMGITLSY